MDKTDTINRWHDILHNIGIRVSDDPMAHTACPICGKGNNSHRFRFDNKDGRGTWICTQCGAGDGFSLVQQVKGYSFKDAASLIEGVLHLAREKVITSRDDIDSIKKNIMSIYQSSKELRKRDQVDTYLMSRGIMLSGINDLRYCEKCYCKEAKKDLSAMIAVVRNREGKVVGLHRTYLNGHKKADLQNSKMLTKCTQKLNCCAIRLFPSNGVVGVAEGIETALSAYIIKKIPVWSAISAKILESFDPPEGTKKVVVFGDRDSNFAGQASAYQLAHRLSKKYDVDVMMPYLKDWNEDLFYGEY